MQKVKLNIMSVVLAFVVLLSLMCGITANAEDTYRTEVTNIVEVGEVDISLNVYTHDSSGLPVPIAAQQKVHPGQDVDMLVTVSNLANEVWLRIKPAISSESGLEEIDESFLMIDTPANWVKKGSYYYLKTPLPSKDNVTFIRGLTIPSTIKNSQSGKKFTVDIVAEVVQTKNFDPDLTSDDPWFGTVIEECVHNTKSDYDYGSLLSIEFENGAEGLVRYGDDIINMWGTLMPGDTISDTVQLANNYSKAVDMYFRIEKLDESELLSQLDITISYGGTELYNGKMDGSVMNKTLLATLYPGDSGQLDFTIYVPRGLKNQYALTTTAMKWIFTADFHDETAPDDPSSSTSDSPSSTTIDDSSSTTSADDSSAVATTSSTDSTPHDDTSKTVIGKFIDNVKTGLASPVGQIGLLGSAVLIMFVIRPRRNKSNEDDNDT
ncbi:MAG: hypothetical protein IJ571_06575 [Ruminococcus sp.]|nr:hypothetical protein [Ruminococcus sp.]